METLLEEPTLAPVTRAPVNGVVETKPSHLVRPERKRSSTEGSRRRPPIEYVRLSHDESEVEQTRPEAVPRHCCTGKISRVTVIDLLPFQQSHPPLAWFI